MSIASYNALSSDTPVGSGANTTSVTGNPQDANSATSLENEFISLMVAQIQNQDPLNPLDGTEYVSQLAQFSQVQSTENMASMMQKQHGFARQHASFVYGRTGWSDGLCFWQRVRNGRCSSRWKN